MSKAADEAQQNPVGHPTVFEDMPSTTDGQRQKLTKQSSRKPKSYLPFLLSSRAAVVCNRAFSKCVFSAAAALYSSGFVGNVWRVIEWCHLTSGSRFTYEPSPCHHA